MFRVAQRAFRVLFVWVLLVGAHLSLAQQRVNSGLSPPQRATKLAELMCHQVANVGTILNTTEIPSPKPGSAVTSRPVQRYITDDVYDALISLGPYSVPCLVDQLTNTQWMPDPREEPLLGIPVVGDVAYMTLTDKGVKDLLPGLAGKKPNEMRMDEYFLWPSLRDHRLRLQSAVRRWLRGQPRCCGEPPLIPQDPGSEPRFRMSAPQLAAMRSRFSRLRPG